MNVLLCSLLFLTVALAGCGGGGGDGTSATNSTDQNPPEVVVTKDGMTVTAQLQPNVVVAPQGSTIAEVSPGTYVLPAAVAVKSGSVLVVNEIAYKVTSDPVNGMVALTQAEFSDVFQKLALKGQLTSDAVDFDTSNLTDEFSIETQPATSANVATGYPYVRSVVCPEVSRTYSLGSIKFPFGINLGDSGSKLTGKFGTPDLKLMTDIVIEGSGPSAIKKFSVGLSGKIAFDTALTVGTATINWPPKVSTGLPAGCMRVWWTVLLVFTPSGVPIPVGISVPVCLEASFNTELGIAGSFTHESSFQVQGSYDQGKGMTWTGDLIPAVKTENTSPLGPLGSPRIASFKGDARVALGADIAILNFGLTNLRLKAGPRWNNEIKIKSSTKWCSKSNLKFATEGTVSVPIFRTFTLPTDFKIFEAEKPWMDIDQLSDCDDPKPTADFSLGTLTCKLENAYSARITGQAQALLKQTEQITLIANEAKFYIGPDRGCGNGQFAVPPKGTVLQNWEYMSANCSPTEGLLLHKYTDVCLNPLGGLDRNIFVNIDHLVARSWTLRFENRVVVRICRGNKDGNPIARPDVAIDQIVTCQ